MYYFYYAHKYVNVSVEYLAQNTFISIYLSFYFHRGLPHTLDTEPH